MKMTITKQVEIEVSDFVNRKVFNNIVNAMRDTLFENEDFDLYDLTDDEQKEFIEKMFAELADYTEYALR